jgi:hypothetical protein
VVINRGGTQGSMLESLSDHNYANPTCALAHQDATCDGL